MVLAGLRQFLDFIATEELAKTECRGFVLQGVQTVRGVAVKTAATRTKP